MAILSKIRDKSMILIIIVGLALFSFVLDPSSIQSFFSSEKVNAIGAINGEDIDREEFTKQLEAFKTQNNRAQISQTQSVKSVWDAFVSEKIFENQLEETGIVVGEKDVWDAIVSLPDIQNSPLFKNEANLFDEEKLKEYIANMKDEASQGEANEARWQQWLTTERNIKQSLERQSYMTMVTSGLGVSLEEGKRDYLFQNTNISGEFVYIPYSTIADSLSTVSTEEIKKYVENHPKKYKAEASRSLKFIKFDIAPSISDKEDEKAKVEGFISDKIEYDKLNGTKDTISGLKNATDYREFLRESESDLELDDSYKFKSEFPVIVADDIFNASIGDVIGAYEDKDYYKISKIIETIKIPDSVKSSHIIIPYLGTTRSISTKTEEEAKKTADSIFTLVRNNKDKFKEIADAINTDGTKGNGGEIGWVTKNQAFSGGFDIDFADFIYKNNNGSIKVVKTAFGFHIIRIDEQTEAQEAVKLVTFGRLIVPSDITESDIYEKSELVMSDLDAGKTIDEISTEKSYKVQSALNLKRMDENVPGLDDQRQIVRWAFEEREIGDAKRFEIDLKGKRIYVIAVLSEETDDETVALSSKIVSEVRPILINEKKAKMIIDTKVSGTTLEEIAKNASVTVRKATDVKLASPLISGVGNEPSIVGAMSTIKIDKVSKPIEGKKGVFVIKVLKREDPVDLENYESFRSILLTKLKARTGSKMYDVLKEKADIKDSRSNFY